MTSLSSFTAPANVAVIGASGGIGSALVDQLLDDPATGRVTALSRSILSAAAPKLTRGVIDITDENSIAACAAAFDAANSLDLVIVATGILHDSSGLQPEKRMRDLDMGAFEQVFAVNTFGPALVAKHFLPRMRRNAKTVFAALSARVGSISDNRLGGWPAYRSSKAALNMLLKTLAIEHARARPDSAIIGLHPGTVDTNLSRPFQANVPDGKLFTPAYSASRLLGVVDRVGSEDTGLVFAWDGSPIEY